MSDLGIKQNKCSSFPRLVLGQLFSFPILVSVFLVPLQVTFILSQILWQGDSSRVTFWLPPLHASYCTSSTRCFPMCQGPQPVLVLLVPGSSWFAWSPSKVTPLPSASSFLLAAFNRASHFSEPGAESSGSPASEGRRSLIRSATEMRLLQCMTPDRSRSPNRSRSPDRSWLQIHHLLQEGIRMRNGEKMPQV